MFNVQLKELLKHKQEILFLIKENEKQITQLKIKLSNFEVKQIVLYIKTKNYLYLRLLFIFF